MNLDSNPLQLTPKGAKTRDAVLAVAVDLASAEGLEGLSIGKLAKAASMSKSGLFAHFGSKEDLQRATVEAAREIFIAEVVDPVQKFERGLPRLYGMQSAWIRYVENAPFSGGCFFAAASAEFDSRPGPVRDRIASLTGWWRDMLREEAETARRMGQLESNTDPTLVAFSLHGYVQEANWACRLLEDKRAFEHARSASERLLRSFATPEGLRATKVRRTARTTAPTKDD